VSALREPAALRSADVIPGLTGKAIHIDARAPSSQVTELFKALASETRVSILQYLGDRVVPVNRIAAALGLAPSTASMHIAILEKAGLIHTEMRAASRGLQKVCARTYDELIVELPRGQHEVRAGIEQSMPVGAYSDFHVEPTCGLAGVTGLIGYLDDPGSFYEPERMAAQLIWFRTGYVEYRFPNRVPSGAQNRSLQITAEVCSEAPLHEADWPSDIGVWVNDVHLGDWTCPGDFGGTHGRFTPTWWEEKDSQFGVLKRWRVTAAGTTVDGVPLSPIQIGDLGLRAGEPVRVRLGVRADAVHRGGINIFGRAFGNYPQDVELRVEYDPARRVPATEGQPDRLADGTFDGAANGDREQVDASIAAPGEATAARR
jgi:predicted transcriptional regulator